jgi:hypothetical protein
MQHRVPTREPTRPMSAWCSSPETAPDVSTVKRRREACRRGIQLNRRLAPDVYLGLAEISDPVGHGSEPAVVMRRMPFDERIATGRIVVTGLGPWARDQMETDIVTAVRPITTMPEDGQLRAVAARRAGVRRRSRDRDPPGKRLQCPDRVRRWCRRPRLGCRGRGCGQRSAFRLSHNWSRYPSYSS